MSTATAAYLGLDVPLIKQQLQQLKALHESGTLTLQAYTEASSALERRLLDWILSDTAAASALQASSAPAAVSAAWPQRRMVAALGLLVLALAGGTYLWAARSSAKLPGAMMGQAMAQSGADMGTSNPAPHATNVEQISVMAERLAARLKTQPNDAQGWAMLARSYAVMGNQPEAVKAYEKAVAMLPNDTALLADYAEALAAISKNNAQAKSFEVPRVSAATPTAKP